MTATVPSLGPFAVPSPVTTRIQITATSAHKLFDYLAVAEIGVAAHHYGRTNVPANPGVDHASFAEQVEVRFDAQPAFTALKTRSWPTTLDLTIDPVPQSSRPTPGTPSKILDANQILIGGIHLHAFLTHYENVLHHITARYGKDPELWPETLKFARMTRNAFAHGNELDIRNPKARASWRRLTLSQANNGEKMLYNHIASGDVILLMLDLEDLL
jgi:hypothetical protein